MGKWQERKEREKKQKDFADEPKADRKVSRPKIKGNEDEVASATKGEVDKEELLKKHRKYGRG